jgi:hypothetical protein
MSLVARIEGYAAIFDAPDGSGDVILPGAFLRRPAPENIRMLNQHEAGAPIGRWTRLEEDAHGLFAEGVLLLESPRAREVWALLKGGALDGLSIGFQTVRAHREGGRRAVAEAALWEISVVTFPMAAGARVLRVGEPESEEARAPDRPPFGDERLLAAALRDAARLFRNPRASV